MYMLVRADFPRWCHRKIVSSVKNYNIMAMCLVMVSSYLFLSSTSNLFVENSSKIINNRKHAHRKLFLMWVFPTDRNLSKKFMMDFTFFLTLPTKKKHFLVVKFKINPIMYTSLYIFKEASKHERSYQKGYRDNQVCKRVYLLIKTNHEHASQKLWEWTREPTMDYSTHEG